MKHLLCYITPLFLHFGFINTLHIGYKPLYNGYRSFSHNTKNILYMRTKKTSDSNSGSGKETKNLSPLYLPKTPNQELYVKYLNDPNTPIVLGVGPAGSGKTLFACNSAVIELKKGNIQKIILTRPVVPVEEDIGFLPGSLINKMDPWTRPIFDIFLEFYKQKDIDAMLQCGVFEISPLAFMRGRTFKNAFVIADEMQNSSPNQMLMLSTRIGTGSKLVITGDLNQSDRGKDNGLADLMRKIKLYDNFCLRTNSTIDNTNAIRVVEMKGLDIQRSPIVSKLLNIYNNDYNSISPSNNIKNIQDLTSHNKNTTSYYITNDKTNSNKIMMDDAAILPIQQTIANSSYFPWTPKNI